MILSISYNVNMDETNELLDKVKRLENELVMMRFGMLHTLTQLNDTLTELQQWQRWQIDTPDIDRLRDIRDSLVAHFDDSEFRNLCFDMGVDYDTLSGENLEDRARELILHHQRRQQLNRLILHCKRLRPSTNWPDLL